MKDKFKTNPVAKKIKEENKKITKRALNKAIKEHYEKEWEDTGIDVPLHARGGAWKWNFEEQETFDKGTVVGYESAASDFKRVNRITWILTVVNVAILISLVIKNL